MKVTTLIEKGESKGFLFAHETILRQDLRDRKLSDKVIEQLKQDATELKADCVSGLKLQCFAFPSGIGLEFSIFAFAEAIKL